MLMAHASDEEKFARGLDRLLGMPRVRELVAAYFDPAPANRFAGEDFDCLGDNPPDRLVADDLLAATLLDIRFPPDAVRHLLHAKAREIGEILEGWQDVPLWKATDEDIEQAQRLWNLLRCRQVNRTKQSKICARKRPQFLPVFDDVVDRYFGSPIQVWRPLRAVLADSDRHRRIENLRPSGLSHRISTLRLLDVAVWMVESRSQYVSGIRRLRGFDG